MCGAELHALPDTVQRVARALQSHGHAQPPVMLQDAARTAQQAADALDVALGQIAIFSTDVGTRPLQAAGAFAYAVAFGLAFVFGASLAGRSGAGQGLWRAAAVLYIVAGLLAAPSWAVLGAQIVQAGDVTIRFTRDLGALLGLLFGTLLFLPIAALLHGLALLRAARTSTAPISAA